MKSDREPNEYEQDAPQWFIDLKPNEKAGLLIQFALVVVGILALVVYGRQLAVMSNQLEEMRSGSVDSHSLALAAKQQAERMQDFATHMKDQADRTKDLADRMKDQAEQTKVIAGQAVVQANAAKKAAEVAEKTLHVSQAAYVSPLSPVLSESGQNVSLPFVNSGHLAADNVEVVVHEATLDTPHPESSAEVLPLEVHWKRLNVEKVFPGPGNTIELPIAAGDPAKQEQRAPANNSCWICHLQRWVL